MLIYALTEKFLWKSEKRFYQIVSNFIHDSNIFIGNALLRRLVRIGVLNEAHMKLDYVLGLKIEDFLERRLQTQVFKLGLAKSIHHARVLIRQRHIR